MMLFIYSAIYFTIVTITTTIPSIHAFVSLDIATIRFTNHIHNSRHHHDLTQLDAVAKRFQSGSDGTANGWIDPSAPVNSEASLRKTFEKSLEGNNFQKRLSILGSTGSIGTQTLEIVDACPENFRVDALSAGSNTQLMYEQVIKYQPKVVSLSTQEAANELKEKLFKSSSISKDDFPHIVWGDDGIIEAATVSTADTVVTGIVGAAGLQPTIEAIKCKKDIALANKETLISGGPVINPLVEKYGVNMVRNIYTNNNNQKRNIHGLIGYMTMDKLFLRRKNFVPKPKIPLIKLIFRLCCFLTNNSLNIYGYFFH
jgi:1-deoxy-D-xylulose 5-phosphate reductoisomerase